MRTHLATVDSTLDDVPGVVSVWYGRPSRPAYTRAPDVSHPAASTMKVAVLAALYRAVDAGTLDLNTMVPVHNEFSSASDGAPRYGCDRGHDSDDDVWQRLGSAARLAWLAERMIVRSSNLATNLVLAEVGLPAVRETLGQVGVRHMVVGRGIEDVAAAEAGIANEVTAADLAALFCSLLLGTVASTSSCTAMVNTLAAQVYRDDLAAGLPPGIRVAHKNGWISGVRHSAGIVFPDDAPPFVLAVCLSTPLAVNRHGDEACQIVSRIAAAAWADRSVE